MVGTAIYVGGDFSGFDNSSRANLGAFDRDTGALLAWQPSADAPVKAIVASDDGTVIARVGSHVVVAGDFATFGSSPSPLFAVVDDSWTPVASSPFCAFGSVRALAPEAGAVSSAHRRSSATMW